MNEMLDPVRSTPMQAQLSSVECRLSILQVNNRPVQTKYALVDLTNISSVSIHFSTDLKLPVDHEFTYSVQLFFKAYTFQLTGSVLQQLGSTSPYVYALDYEMDPMERIELYAAINEIMERAPTRASRAIASYLSSSPMNSVTPKSDFKHSKNTKVFFR